MNAEFTRGIRYKAAFNRKHDEETLAREKARIAAVTKVWWVPYHKRADHPTLYLKNSPQPKPIPGPEEMDAQAPTFIPLSPGSVPNSKKERKGEMYVLGMYKTQDAQDGETHRTVRRTGR